MSGGVVLFLCCLGLELPLHNCKGSMKNKFCCIFLQATIHLPVLGFARQGEQSEGAQGGGGLAGGGGGGAGPHRGAGHRLRALLTLLALIAGAARAQLGLGNQLQGA